MSKQRKTGLQISGLAIALSVQSFASAKGTMAIRDGSAGSDSFGEITTAVISDDGRWFSYAVSPVAESGTPNDLPVTISVAHLNSRLTRTYFAGTTLDGAGHLQMAESGNWLGFMSTVSTPAADSESTPAGNIRKQAILINAESGARLELPNTGSFKFLGSAGTTVLLTSPPSGAQNKTFQLTVMNIRSNQKTVFPNVSEIAVNRTQTKLAFIDDSGLQIFDLASNTAAVVAGNHSERCRSLAWSNSGSAIAYICSVGADSTLEIASQFAGERSSPESYRVLSRALIPTAYKPERAAGLIWRGADRGIFIRLSKANGGTEISSSQQNFPLVWKWTDQVVPHETGPRSNRSGTEIGFLARDTSLLTIFQGVEVDDANLVTGGKYLLAYDISAYDWTQPNLRDYYLIDLESGTKVQMQLGLVVVPNSETLTISPTMSPDGASVIYQNQSGSYVRYDVETSRRHDLTARLPSRFFYDENDPARGRNVRMHLGANVLQGWTDDGEFVLISDYRDVWALPLKDRSAVNLTGNIHGPEWEYDLFVPSNYYTHDFDAEMPGVPSVSLSKSLYFTVSDSDHGRNGLARRNPVTKAIDQLRLEPAIVSYLKARNSDVFLGKAETSVLPPEYYLFDRSFRVRARVTNLNPEELKHPRWGRARYLSYTTSHGDRLHATLYVPVIHYSARSCPTIVQVYEEIGGLAPYLTSTSYFPGLWLNRGYCVLTASVRPRTDEPGPSALEGVIAAVRAAAETGVIDQRRLALMGESYGALEVEFIATKLDIFKVAVILSGESDLVSRYGGMYVSSGPASIGMETRQPYLSGPWWDHWDVYLRNSPLFHAGDIKIPVLLIHGDLDSAVPFSQAVEMFNTLRRQGSHPVTLLEYPNEDHVFSPAAQHDIDERMGQIFDHFLKGTAAPSWWADRR